MFDESALEREATVNVDRGLYLLRYESGAASGASPVSVALPASGSEPFIEVISAPGIVTGFLSRPGECLVVRAERSGLLSIKIRRQSPSASLDASFRLEPVFIADAAVSTFAAPNGGSAIAAPLAQSFAQPLSRAGGAAKFKLLAHVSRRGDVEVGAGEWVAGPQAPAAIEGIELRAAWASGLGIEVQPLVASNPPRWLDWAPAGVFAGSRGRSLALAGLRLRLVGDEAPRFLLSVDALFLGSPIVSRRGREIELVGAAAGDPLVGLRIDMAPEAVSVAGDGFAREAAFSPLRSEPRVRVFRAAVGN
ncbi:hypothetical protein [uncultured Rhodoblastus sp.]|uniref:hypothetical protein n=1 Tax=uncultured Rhodoblastus sp. TaxID=543037 RepID=UPI0025FADEE5|nr:hypothetical protein [uncultured Rhodoblastus sp.]